MSETHRRRVVAKIYTFVRVGLHTSRRRAADASAPLERAPTSERGVAGQLPRPARRSKKGPVRRGLRGRAARGGVPSRRSCSFIIRLIFEHINILRLLQKLPETAAWIFGER